MFGIIGTDKKDIVGLAITPSLGLEAAVYSRETGEIVKYARKFLEYNIASKEIQDLGAFRSVLSDIFNELGVQKDKVNVFLVLPNVHFGFRNIDDSTVDNDAIDSMVLTESQTSYIFKQEEPMSAWVDVNAKTGAATKYIAYSSIQRKVVEAIEDAMSDVGISIVGIESATTAIPRGIALTGLATDVITNNRNWDILLINPNGYSIFQMSGPRILDYVEVPFAVMSFEGSEVYSALSSAIGQYLPNYPAKKLFITSLTDNVSANILKKEIVFENDIVAIDSNTFSKEPCISVGGDVVKQSASGMSLNVIGASKPKYNGFATLNVYGNMSYDGIISYGEIPFGEKDIEITSENVSKFSLIFAGVCLILALFLCLSFKGIDQHFSSASASLREETEQLNAEIIKLEKQLRESILNAIKSITDSNKTAVNYYDSLSSDIPSNVWLTYYNNTNGSKVGIEGYSIDIDAIYEYFKSLKVLAPKTDIKLNKLEVFREDANGGSTDADNIVLDNNDSQQLFSFEISNTSYSKSFDENGNKVSGSDFSGSEEASYAAKIPDIPDIEINLKEIK